MKIKLSILVSLFCFWNHGFSKEILLPAKPSSFKIGMYNVKQTHVLKVFIEKEKGSQLKLEIKDEKGESLLVNYVSKKAIASRIYIDLNALKDGNYILEFSNKSEKFTKELNLSSKEVVNNEKKIVF